jgi:hypothetical protein
MSKLVIKMVYNPNVSNISNKNDENFSLGYLEPFNPPQAFNKCQSLQITKVKIQETDFSQKPLLNKTAFWQEEKDHFWVMILGTMLFSPGLVLGLFSFIDKDLNEYFWLYSLLILFGSSLIFFTLKENSDEEISLGD